MLSLLLSDHEQNEALTKSTKKTNELLKKGYTIEEIAEFRNLKTSTIEDHIVEIALNSDNFSIDDFVNKQNEKNILDAAHQIKSKQLKKIKIIVPAAKYFEIRLVLAKHEGKQWN